MLVIPAIDLMGGEVVRLSKGDFATKVVYSRRPAEVAAGFRRAGARRLHVVDLDGARAGKPVNLDSVRAIAAEGVEIEVGGGLRSLPDIEQVLALGTRFAVLGTAAVERLDLVRVACQKFPGRVVAGIDAKGGEVAIAGWEQGTGLPAVEVARRVRGAGVTLLTLGQYLRPSPDHLPLDRWVTPAEFARWGERARALGFAEVASGPLVRSSYHAERLAGAS